MATPVRRVFRVKKLASLLVALLTMFASAVAVASPVLSGRYEFTASGFPSTFPVSVVTGSFDFHG